MTKSPDKNDKPQILDEMNFLEKPETYTNTMTTDTHEYILTAPYPLEDSNAQLGLLKLVMGYKDGLHVVGDCTVSVRTL